MTVRLGGRLQAAVVTSSHPPSKFHHVYFADAKHLPELPPVPTPSDRSVATESSAGPSPQATSPVQPLSAEPDAKLASAPAPAPGVPAPNCTYGCRLSSSLILTPPPMQSQ